jgi:hypothetical protein
MDSTKGRRKQKRKSCVSKNEWKKIIHGRKNRKEIIDMKQFE